MSKSVLVIAALVLVGCGPLMSIHEAAETGNIEAVKQHLDAETNVDVMSIIFKETPLHIATREGHKEIVELLIAKDADVNSKDFFGRTSLNWAAREGRTEIADLLRKHGGKTGAELKAEGK